MSNLTHFNKKGDVHMVDVADKLDSIRVAYASGEILMKENTLQEIQKGNSKKGDILGVARIAAIQAAKKTSALIPLCHLILIDNIEADFVLVSHSSSVICKVRVQSTGKTGVEMEALTAVQIGLLTIYDMLKSIDRGMIITKVRLDKKTGGKSGEWKRSDD